MQSFLLDMDAEVAEDTRIEDLAALSNATVPGMDGGWLCIPPMEVLGMMRTTCSRFLPKEDSLSDPTY